VDWGRWIPDKASPFAAFLYAVAAVYLVLFAFYFVMFPLRARDARQGRPDAVARYNRLRRGFPGGFYAKMMGRKPL
jgi:hypothetical protein